MTKQGLPPKSYSGQMLWTVLCILPLMAALLFITPSVGRAENSVITTAEGMAALGDDKTRNQTMSEARALARRNAAEKAATHIQSMTRVEDFTLARDLVQAYAEAVVTILEELEAGWTSDPRLGDSFRVVIRAEVTPNLKAMSAGRTPAGVWADDPAAPLTVRLTSAGPEYTAGEKATFYLKGNKPFFARVVYEDTAKNLIQILPNPYRTDTYFEGGVVYSLPSGKDQYELTVVPPFGEERVIVYASTRPLGTVEQQDLGPVYRLEENREQVAARTRGIQLTARPTAGTVGAANAPGAAEDDGTAEFFETSLVIQTGP